MGLTEEEYREYYWYVPTTLEDWEGVHWTIQRGNPRFYTYFSGFDWLLKEHELYGQNVISIRQLQADTVRLIGAGGNYWIDPDLEGTEWLDGVEPPTMDVQYLWELIDCDGIHFRRTTVHPSGSWFPGYRHGYCTTNHLREIDGAWRVSQNGSSPGGTFCDNPPHLVVTCQMGGSFAPKAPGDEKNWATAGNKRGVYYMDGADAVNYIHGESTYTWRKSTVTTNEYDEDIGGSGVSNEPEISWDAGESEWRLYLSPGNNAWWSHDTLTGTYAANPAVDGGGDPYCSGVFTVAFEHEPGDILIAPNTYPDPICGRYMQQKVAAGSSPNQYYIPETQNGGTTYIWRKRQANRQETYFLRRTSDAFDDGGEVWILSSDSSGNPDPETDYYWKRTGPWPEAEDPESQVEWEGIYEPGGIGVGDGGARGTVLVQGHDGDYEVSWYGDDGGEWCGVYMPSGGNGDSNNQSEYLRVVGEGVAYRVTWYWGVWRIWKCTNYGSGETTNWVVQLSREKATGDDNETFVNSHFVNGDATGRIVTGGYEGPLPYVWNRPLADIIGPWLFVDIQKFLNKLVAYKKSFAWTANGEDNYLNSENAGVSSAWATSKAQAEAAYALGGGMYSGSSNASPHAWSSGHELADHFAHLGRQYSYAHVTGLPTDNAKKVSFFIYVGDMDIASSWGYEGAAHDIFDSYSDFSGDVDNCTWHLFATETVADQDTATGLHRFGLASLPQPDPWCNTPDYLGGESRGWETHGYIAAVRYDFPGGFTYY